MTNDELTAHRQLLTTRYGLAPPVAIGSLGHGGVNNAVWLVIQARLWTRAD